MMASPAIWIETQRQRETELRRRAEAHRLVGRSRRLRLNKDVGMRTAPFDVIGVPSSMGAFARG